MLNSYIELTGERAVMPTRALKGDVGYDLTLIDRKVVDPAKWGPNIQVYGTGVKVTPYDDFYWEIVPRSSMAKTPYIMPHSVGVIDQEYTGEVLVVLRKVDLDRDDLELPCRIVQLVPRPKLDIHFILSSLTQSVRGEGGFGSTGV